MKKRLLVVTHNLQFEGAPQSQLAIVRELVNDYETFVVSAREGELHAEYERLGATVIDSRAPLFFLPERPFDPAQFRVAFKYLTSIMQRFEIDLVFVNTLLNHLPVLAARYLDIPVVWSIRESIEDLREVSPLVRKALSQANRVVFCSDTSRRVLEKYCSSAATVFNGVDAEHAREFKAEYSPDACKQLLRLPLDRPIVTIVGTPCPRKGHGVFLEMMSRTIEAGKNCHFVVVGFQPYFSAYSELLREKIMSLPGEDVSLFERTADIRPFFCSADIVAVPSYNESFPRVVLEAMAFGKPVVAFDAWGATEQIVHEQTGLLVPVGDVSAFSRSVWSLLDDARRADELGLAGEERVQKEFSLAKMSAGYEKIFEEVLNEETLQPPIERPFFETHKNAAEYALACSDFDEFGRLASRFGNHPESASRLLELVFQAYSSLRSGKLLQEGDIVFDKKRDFLTQWLESSSEKLSSSFPPHSSPLKLPDRLEGLQLDDMTLGNLQGEGVFFSSLDLSAAKIFECDLSRATLLQVLLVRSTLRDVVFRSASFRNVAFDEVRGEGSDFQGAVFAKVTFSQAVLSESNFANAVFVDCLFGGAAFDNCNFQGAYFRCCHFENFEGGSSRFDKAVFTECVFSEGKTGIFAKDEVTLLQSDVGSFLPEGETPENISSQPSFNQDLLLSICVISRSRAQLETLLQSIAQSDTTVGLEVHVAWNGSEEEMRRIAYPENVPVFCHSITPYHFAGNNNRLAEHASGSLLLFLNDDMLLDKKTISSALEVLLAAPSVGLVGARLRDEQGLCQHAGIFFDSMEMPYHRYKYILPAEQSVFDDLRVVPAVTGAFMLCRKDDFLQVMFDEEFSVCGEDIVLCLDFQQKLGKRVVYAPKATAVHLEGFTRRFTNERLTPARDLERIIDSRKHLQQLRAEG